MYTMNEVAVDLYAIRHLQSVANTEPHIVGGRSNHSPLADGAETEGVRTAQALMERRVVPDVVVASPAIRTMATAEIILSTMGITIEPIIQDELQELDQGEWTGRIRSEVYTPEIFELMELHAKDFKADGGESMNEVGLRMYSHIDTFAGLAPQVDGRPLRVFAFTHGLAIRCLAGHIENWDRKQIYTTETPNGSVSKFLSRSGVWRVEYIGHTAEELLQ